MRGGMLLAVVLLVAASRGQEVQVSNRVQGALSPSLYSMFFETEINFGSEGGLYAELVRNRDFEALGRDRGARGKAPPPDYTSYHPWTPTGSSVARLSNHTAPFATNPTVLELTTGGDGSGMRNPGYWGMHVVPGAGYKVSLWGRSDKVRRLAVRLLCGETEAGRTGDLAVGKTWGAVEATLTVGEGAAGCSDGAAEVVPLEAGTVLLDSVSIFPGDAVGGLFRKDLFDLLKAFAPPLLRIPGGNYLEGYSERNRWEWKATIGVPANRTGHFSPWGYWVTDGMGLYEMLLLAKLIGASPILGVNTGYLLTREYLPLNQSAPRARDAADLLEYCNGPATSYWGALRARDGSSAPFGLRHVEVGNEEFDNSVEGYQGHYKLITSALWKEDPELQVVASGDYSWSSGKPGCSPCTGGCGGAPQRCDAWDIHTYRDPDAMAELHDTFDGYTSTCPTCPKVTVLEYAARGKPVLQNAVAEALFLIGAEKNAEVVQTTAFAPLLCNTHGKQWPYNLINFNTSRSFALPSYYVQLLLKETLGDHTVATVARGAIGANRWNATASVKGGTVSVKIVNYGNASASVPIAFDGFGEVAVLPTARLVTSASPDDENTLDNPTHVKETTMPISPTSPLRVALPPWSVVVVQATYNP